MLPKFPPCPGREHPGLSREDTHRSQSHPPRSPPCRPVTSGRLTRTGTHIVNGGDEQQSRADDVEDDDEGQNHQHVHRAVEAKGQPESSERDGEPEDGREKPTPVSDKTKLTSTIFNRISENFDSSSYFPALKSRGSAPLDPSGIGE